MACAQASSATQVASDPWRGFAPGIWQSFVNVREFIQRNYTPYEGDGTFLQGSTARTQGLWQKLLPLFAQFAREVRHAFRRTRVRSYEAGPGHSGPPATCRRCC